jgi:hypothetical protein
MKIENGKLAQPSLRAAKRRSNPENNAVAFPVIRNFTGLLRRFAARNDGCANSPFSILMCVLPNVIITSFSPYLNNKT